jgi:glycosyltransferase involved in cell wall biosynthesis
VEDSVIDGENGLLCPEDVDGFAQRMIRLATDADLRARLSEGARQSRHRFDIRNTSARLLAHYERLVEERRRRRKQSDR